MFRIFRLKLFLIIMCLVFAVKNNAIAGCGLQDCPSVVELQPQKPVTIDNQLTYTNFNLDGRKGDYFQYTPRIHYFGWNRIIAGGFVPIVRLDDGEEKNTGMGNPVIYGEYILPKYGSMLLSLGSQLEFPFGDDENGIAGDHTAALPYVSLRNAMDSFNLVAHVGYRYSFNSGGSGHANPEHTPLLVNPHGDKELVYRGGVEKKLPKDNWIAKLFLDGQHVIEGEDEGVGFLSTTGQVGYSVSERTDVMFLAELPLTSPRRFDSRVGINCSFQF